MIAAAKLFGIDLFCGAGGLTHGLQQAGIPILAGIDSDPSCEFPFAANNKARFIQADIRDVSGKDLAKLYPAGSIRLLAGCAPCRPFSSLRRGPKKEEHDDWGLLTQFGRIARELRPELITMENVPRLRSKPIFSSFVSDLEQMGYSVVAASLYCPKFGIPQRRRRLVLLASRIGPISIPKGGLDPSKYKTVRQAIGTMKPLTAGEAYSKDPLHRARSLNPTNLRRLKASTAGGTWHDWPEDLRAPCHRKDSGKSFRSVYSRMSWDEPSPTITTQSFNFGTGRFGHPEQDRALTLREAAILQTFPRKFRFVRGRGKIHFAQVGKLIGNAVPPRLAYFVGMELARTAHEYQNRGITE